MPGFVPVVVHSSGSSLKNPCPSGTGIGYATLNGTDMLFVICSSAFNSNTGSSPPNPLELGLGVGLGLGIPLVALCVGSYIYIKYGYFFCYSTERHRQQQQQQQQPTLPPQPQLTNKQQVEQLIHNNPRALSDFKNGLLTPHLMEVLKDIRKTEGRELNECSNYAKELGFNHIADYVANLTVLIMNAAV